jgi:hypothetical protein
MVFRKKYGYSNGLTIGFALMDLPLAKIKKMFIFKFYMA